MTIQHGIDHLKKHDSSKNRILAAMLTTILEQLDEDIPLPEAPKEPHSYAIDLPQKMGLVAIADKNHVAPDLDPIETNERLEEMAQMSADIMMLAGPQVKAALGEVPGKNEKLPVTQRMLGKGRKKTEFSQDVPEIAKRQFYTTETGYDVSDTGNKLTYVAVRVSDTEKNTKGDFSLDMKFDDLNMKSIGFTINSKAGYDNLVAMARQKVSNSDTVYNDSENVFAKNGDGLLQLYWSGYPRGARAILNLDPGDISYSISSEFFESKAIKTYRYDGEKMASRMVKDGKEEITDSVTPEEFIDFAKFLLSIVPLQEHA